VLEEAGGKEVIYFLLCLSINLGMFFEWRLAMLEAVIVCEETFQGFDALDGLF
jgi:hypothetical protein